VTAAERVAVLAEIEAKACQAEDSPLASGLSAYSDSARLALGAFEFVAGLKGGSSAADGPLDDRALGALWACDHVLAALLKRVRAA
jgi:hypothetical protein